MPPSCLFGLSPQEAWRLLRVLCVPKTKMGCKRDPAAPASSMNVQDLQTHCYFITHHPACACLPSPMPLTYGVCDAPRLVLFIRLDRCGVSFGSTNS